MANRVPCYFLPPTWDLPPPPLGPLGLGSVLASPKTVERPLHTPPPPAEGDVFSTTQRNFRFSTDKMRSGQLGVFTRFLSFVLGVGVDAAVGWESLQKTRLSLATLTTHQFNPSPRDLAAFISADPVRRFLEKSRYRKPLYVVTGIKVARCGGGGDDHLQDTDTKKDADTDNTATAAASERSLLVRAEASVEVDPSALLPSLSLSGLPIPIIPISAGPGLAGSQATRQTVAWQGASDFVFAFRLRKITVATAAAAAAVAKKKKAASASGDDDIIIIKDKDYLAGALLGQASGSSAGNPAGGILDLCVVSEEDIEFNAGMKSEGEEEENEDGFSTVTLEEGEEEVVCMVPEVDMD